LVLRRISVELAERYLKQGRILDNVTGKNLTCFLFENDKYGFEVSIPNPSRGKMFQNLYRAQSIHILSCV
jgi:hypothetical protein